MPITNYTNLLAEEAIALLDTHGVRIDYGGVYLVVLKSDLDVARRYIADTAVSVRQHMMSQLDEDLRELLPKIAGRLASKETSDDFCGKLKLWTALKEVSVQ